ncbi:four helix bundle protein [Prevotella sp. ne3005]|uniref:four helix bundle protein n=1 Tax=Prevotella sp. ne3005 TaxID=1761887 RepID=UPI000B805DF9|nr:four helix bundle protein [Prevotella sp. ne3005]
MDKFTFFDIRVYKEAKLLVREVYTLMDKYPKYETYALRDQLRRAVVFVPSNIAEGSGRFSINEKIHFIEIAYGSLTETLCQLDIAHDLDYINDNEFEEEKERIDVIGKQLSGLRASFQKQLESANR